MSPSAGSHVVHHGKQSRVVRSPEKSLWSPCGLSWHRRCSLLVVRHVGVGGSEARWPPPHWGRFGARSRPLVGRGDRRRASPASNDVPPSLIDDRPLLLLLREISTQVSDPRRTRTIQSRAFNRQNAIHPSIHPPSSPSHGRLIDVHLPTAPIQGIIKKALAFSVP